MSENSIFFFLLSGFFWFFFFGFQREKYVLKKKMPIYLIFFSHVVGIINLSVCSQELRFSSLN